jgi:hypothetical protein
MLIKFVHFTVSKIYLVLRGALYWSLDEGLHTCEAGTLLLVSYPQPFLLWLFWI